MQLATGLTASGTWITNNLGQRRIANAGGGGGFTNQQGGPGGRPIVYPDSTLVLDGGDGAGGNFINGGNGGNSVSGGGGASVPSGRAGATGTGGGGGGGMPIGGATGYPGNPGGSGRVVFQDWASLSKFFPGS
jgi:hypothetical protein